MVEDNNTSLLAAIGGAVCFIFRPLGFGTWQATVATVTGLIAKENVVSTFGVLFGLGADLTEEDPGLLAAVGTHFTALSAYSFMIFNLLCAPCFAAMGAIKREMNNARWTLGAIGYMCGFAYVVSLIVYQLGGLITGEASAPSPPPPPSLAWSTSLSAETSTTRTPSPFPPLPPRPSKERL